ncbi:hypothetical protein [Fusobacterium sp.]|uniref:hypothetical protein n=1 Tax=Fusobacterium sp. TaxID=68766 RepID=UPI00263303C1|nr:hypothetical protein [Fusobacterium sp.]
MTRKNYGYGSYFEDGKFYDKDGNEIKDIKEFYIMQKKKHLEKNKSTTKKRYGYGGDGSYERKNTKLDILNKNEFPENL